MKEFNNQLTGLLHYSTAMLKIRPLEPIGERFMKIRHNYSLYKEMVDQGLASWNDDPYFVADWINLFTPIEMAAWQDIRSSGFVMWPQFPIGRYFADFACPMHKLILECDGVQWHDAEKDRKRDAELEAMGWITYRATGRLCKATNEDGESAMQPLINEIKRTKGLEC